MEKRRYYIPTCEAIDLAVQQVLCESLTTGGEGMEPIFVEPDDL